MRWRVSTTFRVMGLAFLVLGAVVGGRMFIYIGAGLLITGWILLLRERRLRPPR
jgi:hypothetical protein